MARTFLQVSNADYLQRTWQAVMDAIVDGKQGKTRIRWERAVKDKAFTSIRTLPIVETKAETLLAVLKQGGVATNIFLRRLHNYALGMNWLLAPVIPNRQWPKVEFKPKRAITADEHLRIIEREKNNERRAFYEACWHTGAAQSDTAGLCAENVDWQTRTLTFFRMKTGNKSQLEIGPELETVLRSLPASGPLFPNLSKVRESDRATEFKQRCRGLEIEGVTLHSYRYAWAERVQGPLPIQSVTRSKPSVMAAKLSAVPTRGTRISNFRR
ncbi:MAG: hypothetical protein HC841_02015 [Verrucomicrobiae bacterium]|nr:hypothetical protein [Verrucomicrobiae bacterium]